METQGLCVLPRTPLHTLLSATSHTLAHPPQHTLAHPHTPSPEHPRTTCHTLTAAAHTRISSNALLLAWRTPSEGDFFIDNLLVRIHLFIEMILVDRPCAMKV